MKFASTFLYLRRCGGHLAMKRRTAPVQQKTSPCSPGGREGRSPLWGFRRMFARSSWRELGGVRGGNPVPPPLGPDSLSGFHSHSNMAALFFVCGARGDPISTVWERGGMLHSCSRTLINAQVHGCIRRSAVIPKVLVHARLRSHPGSVDISPENLHAAELRWAS